MEIRQINRFTNYYIGNDGFVYKRCGKNRGLKKLKGAKQSQGYLQIALYKDGKVAERHLIHRLVAQYFIPNPENKPNVDHIDTNILNNSAANLRWTSPKENSNNPLTLEHGKRAQREIAEKPIICKKDGVEIKFDNQYFAEQFFGCRREHLMKAMKQGETFYGFSISQMELYDKLH